MSFFFTKNKPPVQRAAPITRQNTDTLFRLGCTACPLNAGVRMKPTLSPQTEVYFLGSSPDEDERYALSGSSGKLLRSVIPAGKLHLCSFDNVINCSSEKGATWQETECCRPRRHRYIEEATPKLIVGLGSTSLNWLLGSSDTRNLRGRVYAVKIGNHECHFMPTYDPAFVIEKAYRKDKPLNSRWGHCFRMDIDKVFNIVGDLTPVHIDNEEEIRSRVQCFDGSNPEPVYALLEEAKKAPIKSIDIETSCLRPYSPNAKILTVAISFGDTNFSFAWDHPHSKWGQNTKQLYELVESLLKDDTTKVAHNAPFELEWLSCEFGGDVVNHTAWECTMMQAHFLDERKGGNREDDNTGANRYLGLDFLCKLHFGFAYKSLFKLNKKDMASSDLGETLIYNGVDTKYTLKLYYLQKQLLKKAGLNRAYMEAAARQPTVALMQRLGIPVNQNEINSLQIRLGNEIQADEAEIEALDVVQKYKADHKGVFNPLSGPDTLKVFKEYLKREEVYVQGKGNTIGRYSVDKHVLDKIDHPLAKLVTNLRHITKMKSTYVDGLELNKGEIIYPDGRLHTSFHTTGTETGRLSSSSPNMQNFPKRGGGDIYRRAIVAPPGHLMVAVDYKQLEGSTTAMCSKDAYYIKALKDNYDTHMVWAKRLAELVPTCTKEVNGKFRSMIKNKLVFPSFFGASNESVLAYLSDGCGMPMPKDKIDIIMDEFWDTFDGVKRWQDRLMKDYYQQGWVATLSGRRRNYPLSRNEAINHPVQGTAAELVCDAMVRLSYLASSTSRWHLHPVLNVHDDLTFIVPDDDDVLNDAINIIVREMLTFDFPWINVPLACEVSVGPNWCDLKKLGEFWSK